METGILITGIIFIILGPLVKKWPMLLAGYNTMSNESKKNVDVNGLASFICKSFIVTGLLTISGYFIFHWLGLNGIAEYFIFVPIVSIVITLAVAQRFDHNERKRKKGIQTAVIVATFFLIAGMLVYGYMPAKLIVENDSVRFTGMYGKTVPASDIEDVKISPNIPNVGMRLNGLGAPGVWKGYFDVEGYGRSLLFIRSKDKGPYVILVRKEGCRIYYYAQDSVSAERYYSEIRRMQEK